MGSGERPGSPAHAALRLQTHERRPGARPRGRGRLHRRTGAWGALLATAEKSPQPSGFSPPPNSALVVECYTLIHSVKPTESLLRDRASRRPAGQWLWARVHRRAGSQGWAPRLADDRKPLVPMLWTVPGETLTPAFSPASHPSAGRCPGRWITRRTPGEWVSGAPLWWWRGVPGCPPCLQGGCAQLAARGPLSPSQL